MSDQCKHCILRGDLTECEKEACYHHDAWYVQTILARHNALVEAVALERRKAA